MDLRSQIAGFSPGARSILVATFLSSFAAGSFSLLYNLYLLSLGHHADFMGLVASVSTLSTALVGPLVILWARRVRHGSLLVCGFGLQAVGGAIQATAVDPAVILLGSALTGLAFGLYWAPMPPFLAENSTPRERNALFSVNISVQLTGGILANLICGAVPAILLSRFSMGAPEAYRATLLAAPCMALLAARVMMGHVRATPVVVAAPAAPFRQSATRRNDSVGLVLLAISAVTMGVATGLTFPFLNVYFATRFDLGAEAIGRIIALGSVLSAAAALAAPALARRLSLVGAISAARAGGGLAVIALAGAWTLPVAVASYLTRNVLLQTMSALIDAFGMSAMPPALRRIQSATTSTVWHGAYAMASVIAGTLIAANGFEQPFLASAVILVANALIFVAIFRRWPLSRE
jgi:MFS family permease